MAARGVQPGHADAVALADQRHTRTDGGDAPDCLMAGDEGGLRLHRPVALSRVQVRVADAAGFGLDQDLAGTWAGDIHFPHHEWLAEFDDDRSLHFLGHVYDSLYWFGQAAALVTSPRTASIICANTAEASP